MENLPPELFGLIIDRCDHASLKKLRLANKFYCNAVTPRVFEHFYIGILDDSLDTLIAVSRSNLTKHIKSLTSYIDCLPDLQFVDWERAIDYTDDILYWANRSLGQDQPILRGEPERREPLPFGLPSANSRDRNQVLRHGFSPGQLTDGYSAFVAARKQQSDWHHSRQGSVLKESFAMLPNLESVSCVPAAVTRSKRFRTTWPVWKRMRRDIFVDPNDFDHRTPAPFDIMKNEDFSRRVSLSILEAIAFRASFSGTKQITRLRLHSQQRGSWGRIAYTQSVGSQPVIRIPTFERTLNLIPEGFRSLTHIDGCVTHQRHARLDSLYFLMEFTKFLHASCQLRSLNLSYCEWRSRYESELSYPQQIEHDFHPFLDGRPSWPFIKHLGLNMHVQHQKLLSLLEFLSSSLRSLQLIDMGVGDAGELVTNIPRILKLETIQMTRIWHTQARQPSHYTCLFPAGIEVEAPFESAVQSYLLGKSSECPDLGLHGTPTR